LGWEKKRKRALFATPRVLVALMYKQGHAKKGYNLGNVSVLKLLFQ